MPFLHTIYRDFFALLAGVLFTLAFAPFNFGYLAPLALMVLFASWQHASVWRAVLRGYVFGLGSFGVGVSWVYVSIHDFGGAGMLSAGTLTAMFVAFWSLFPALAALFAVKIGAGKNLFLVPCIWVLVEYFRGVMLLNGFPWLLGAYSQLATPLSGYVPIFGAYGTGFLLALSAAMAVAILQRQKQRLLLGGGLALIWLTGGVLRTVDWTHAIGNPIRVSMIQGNISQDQKWRPENRLDTLLLYKKLTEAHWDSDLIIWPETAIPAYLSEVETFFLAPLNIAAQQQGADLIVSLPIEGSGPSEIYNGVITLGKERGQYRKNHLLPFGEYMPWQPVSGFILNKLAIRLGDFTPGGGRQPLLKAAGYPFITSICYEDAFGDVNIAGLPDAAYLVNVTNDAWFGNSLEPHQHLQIASMRALETGRFLLRATNTGATAVIAPDGSIVRLAPLFETAVLTESITPMGGMTPYAGWGDRPVIVGLVIVLLVLLAFNRWALHSKYRLATP
ncbi:MAG: apolipoprotein N-acyltransferase [Methylovulum sp.]|nr:apolipoprotein N-acyltransferase [Methylovulum sp.]